jgi:serine/threonine protein kinase
MLAGQRFGRYEVRSKLGEGGMGQVYTAVDSELGRNVAIKLLPTEFTIDADRQSRFLQEARVISALNHPNIITIYEIGENDQGSFLATEFVDGKTLRDVIKNESVTLPRILKITEQAANALVAAHAAGIVHRDIKPENIMVRRDGIVKVLDFGLAKSRSPVVPISDVESNKTIPGTVMGSARYMSPEQARGLEVDERTDIWSLGIVLYEMLAGHGPFEGETTADTLASVIYKEPEPISHVLPNLPFELQRILKKALQKDRDERYQSVKDLALDIKDLLFELEHVNSGEKSSGHVISRPEINENPTMIHRTISANHLTDQTNIYTSGAAAIPARRPKRMRPALVLVGIVAVLVVSIAGLWAYNSYRGAEVLTASAFTKTQISRINTDGKVIAPALSPDGKYVAYVSGDPGAKTLVVRQISTDSSVTVVPTTNLNLANLTFSPEGDYVYYTETRSDGSVNTLYRIPTLGGTPKNLIEDVDSAVTFSPDGKQIAFIRHATGDSTDNIMIADTTSFVAQPFLSSKDTNYDFFTFRLAWSPDGRKFLIGAGKRQAGFITRTDVCELPLDGDKSLKRLNQSDIYTASNFVWLGDGSGFLFAGRESQNAPVQIWRASYPSMELHQVTNDFNDYLDLGISADGQRLVTLKGDTSSSIWRFSPTTKALTQVTDESRNVEGGNGLIELADKSLIYSRNEAKQSQIWTAAADGKSGRPIVTEPDFAVAPVVSPDGRFLVYDLQKDKASRIWRVGIDGKNAVELTSDDAAVSDYNPQISPDGKSVIFQRQLASVDRSILLRVSIDGGPPEVIYSSDELSAFQPRLSPDGKRVAFITYNVHTFDKRIQIAPIDGGRVGKPEISLEYNLLGQFFWSPDGKSLTALTTRAGTPNLWRLPVDGSAPTPITDFRSGRILNFTWSNDGKELLIARGNSNNDLVMIRDSDAAPDKASLKRSSSRVGSLLSRI